MDKKKLIKKILPWAGLAILTILIAVLPLIASGNDEEEEEKAVIKSEQSALRDIDEVILGGGQLESSDVFEIEIPENIKIKEFLVSNGDTVSEGDSIAMVDQVSVMTAISSVQDTIDELSDQIADASSTNTTSYLTSSPSGTIKKIYAKKGDSVDNIMLEYGALAVISLDNTMAMDVSCSSSLLPGDKVTVRINESEVSGRVKSNVSGVLKVTVTDSSYSIGQSAEVFQLDGTSIGSGTLYVNNPWNVEGYSGTVSMIYVTEGQSIYSGETLFAITESGTSSEYQKAVDKRQKYESLMKELFVLYQSGVITSPCDGIISDVDTDGTYMLSASEDTNNENSIRVFLLEDNEITPVITTTSLAAGSKGSAYSATLQAQDQSSAQTLSGTWAVTGLPGGLSFDSASGSISGTPTVAGTFNLKVYFIYQPESGSAKTVSTDLTLVIADVPVETYTGYVAMLSSSGIMRNPSANTITDLNNLPKVTPSASEMTESVQAAVSGSYSIGDFFWIIYDANGTFYKDVKISSGSGGGEGGSGGLPSGGGGGMSGGSSGFSSVSTEEEDDGLYSLDTLVICNVTSQEEMTLEISIDEFDITKIYVGQKADITMNSLASETIEAVVTKISNSGENSGGNSKFTVDLQLAKSSDMLPGMSATASITTDTLTNVLCVPSAAIYEVDGQKIVYTSYNEKKEQLEDPVVVTTGCADANYVQILSGLDSGINVYYEVYESTQSTDFPDMQGAMMPGEST